MKPFNIGDTVFKADYTKHEKYVTCPDCFGSKHVTVVLGDGTGIEIECGGCDPGGYRPSTGVIKQYEYEVRTHKHTVTGVSMVVKDKYQYELDRISSSYYYTAKDDDVFATEAEAAVHGNKEKDAHEARVNKQLMSKTKDHRSWAWNSTYHRKCIKDLERQLEFHHSKLKICDGKARMEAAK